MKSSELDCGTWTLYWNLRGIVVGKLTMNKFQQSEIQGSFIFELDGTSGELVKGKGCKSLTLSPLRIIINDLIFI